MGVKQETTTKKKRQCKEDVEDKPELIVKTKKVWECLVCGHKQISNERPIKCICTNNGNFVINTIYEVI